jgi:lipopolysaccharide export system protein LptC
LDVILQSQKDGYSRFIFVAKITLPFLAFLLVASIFLFSKTEQVKNGLAISNSDLVSLAVGQKITGPNFSGVTQDGDAFSISADYALPDAPSPSQIDLANAKGFFSFQSGLEIHSSAKDAELNIKENNARLSGSVNITSSDGFNGTTEELLLSFETGIIESPGPIQGTANFGTITAGSMRTSKIESTEDNLLLFQNGVKLIYFPKGQE